MGEQDITILEEIKARTIANSTKIENINEEIKEMKQKQESIHKIATSVEIIAEHMNHIEEKVNDTNHKVDTYTETWKESERRLTEKIMENENAPYKQVAQNVNSIKVAAITCICTFLISGVIGAIIHFV